MTEPTFQVKLTIKEGERLRSLLDDLASSHDFDEAERRDAYDLSITVGLPLERAKSRERKKR